ncbi:MAG: hypothetical protein QW520_03385 [Methanomassiliicoccales archaeon]
MKDKDILEGGKEFEEREGEAMEGTESFEDLVKGEVERDQARLHKLKASQPIAKAGWGLVALFWFIGVLIIMLTEEGLLLWLVCAFLLYSFNFLILFLPTSRRKERMEIPKLRGEVKRPVSYLLKCKKRLAVEVAAVLLLGGLYPLAHAFFLLFGTGLAFALYYVIIAGAYAMESAAVVIFQIVIILGYFGLILWLRPLERGVLRRAKDLKATMAKMRSSGRLASFLFLSSLSLMAAVVGLLAIGAILFTGISLKLVYQGLTARQGEALFGIIVMLSIQLLIMRQFQTVASHSTAQKFLEQRQSIVRQKVLMPLERMNPVDRGHAPLSTERMSDLKTAFYSAHLFDVFEHNFFGRWPVYVIGPRIKFLLDHDALKYME